MTKSLQNSESKHSKKTYQHQESSGRSEEQLVSPVSDSILAQAVSNDDVERLVNLLNNPNVPIIQRQQLAGRVSDIQGNRYLQHVIGTSRNKPNQYSKPEISNRITPNTSIVQLTPEEDIRRECQQRYDRDDYEGIAARNERLRQIFQSVEASHARSLYERLAAEDRARDDLARIFQGSLAEGTRTRMLAILREKFQEAARVERQWYEDHPEPRVSSRSRALILWNFPIDSAEVQPVHLAAVRRFLASQDTVWIHGGTYLEITGRASESGLESHNLDLSRRRAQAICAFVSNIPVLERREIRVTALGISQPLASQEMAEGMARNRSVEIAIIVPEPPPVPGRDQKWRYAQEYLESKVGAPVGGGPDLMWTPTATGVLRMIPRLPLEFTVPDYYGENAPTNDLCSERPASGCMPAPHFETRRILGEELMREFRLNRNLTDRQIEEVVDRFIGIANFALEIRTNRLRELQGKVELGGGGAIERGWELYHRAESQYFFSDPTCVWRYIQSQ